MINPFRRKIDLNDFHQYVHDIGEMQAQREEALKQGRDEEVKQLDMNIQIALVVQERLLENLE